MTVRNEAWILNLSIRAALLWCDEIVVLDHNSKDATPEIISQVAVEYPDRVHRLHSTEESWPEMHHRDATLQKARRIGATHVAVVDADELVTGHSIEVVRAQILALQPYELFELPMIPMWRSFDQYRADDSVWSKATLSLAFADGPGVTWQPRDGYHFHNRVPTGINRPRRGRVRPIVQQGGVMHCQWVNWKRMLWKHLHYELMEMVQHPGRKSAKELSKMYSQASDESNIRLARAPESWLEPYRQWMDQVNLEDEPWQAEACRQMIETYGRGAFHGLNFFGLM